jgi:adhesin/invasin
VVVNNQAAAGARALRVSQPQISTLGAVNPGAAALNGDLWVHTAATPIPAGGYVILFLKAEGSVTPAAPLSIINGTVQVTIGGQKRP